MTNDQNKCANESASKQKLSGESEEKKRPIPAIIKLFRAILVEVALIAWICAEFFSVSGVERPRIAVWLLGITFFFVSCS